MRLRLFRPKFSDTVFNESLEVFLVVEKSLEFAGVAAFMISVAKSSPFSESKFEL